MEWLAWIAIIIAIGFVVWVYNRLVGDRNQVATAWSDVDVQLQRRHDLVPNLVATVKQYAVHERGVFEQVVVERNASRQAVGIGEKGRREAALERNLTGLLALAENYPDLKASANFSQLAHQLVEVEDHLQSARRFYNGSVRQYNTRIEQFPQLLVARTFLFRPAEFFAAEADSKATPGVAL